MTISMGLDILLVLLLIAVLAYAVILNKRLTQLRANKDELARVISSFNEATIRAESSIPRLKKAADEVRSALEDKIDKAQSLRDDLAFMIERGDSMANRLEGSVRMARGETVPQPARHQPSPPQNPLAQPPAAAPRPGDRLGERLADRPGERLGERPRATIKSAAAEGRIEPRLSEPRFNPDDLEARSEAERALLKALQSVR
jgi:hypothetical protein